PADVAIAQRGAVVEVPAGAHVGVDGRVERERPRHAEMHHELGARVEPEDQVLPAAAHVDHGGPGGLRRDRELRGLVRLTTDDPPTGDDRRELAADRLDLRQLRHLVTVASGPWSSAVPPITQTRLITPTSTTSCTRPRC